VNERRIRLLFFAVLAAQLVLLTARAPVSAERDVSILESAGLRVLAPVGRVVRGGVGEAQGFFASLRTRRTLLAENADLERRVAAQQIELLRLSEIEEEARRLAAAVDHGRLSDRRQRVAEVVYKDTASWLSTLIVRTGAPSVAKDSPVVSAAGVVGRIDTVAGGYAKVLLATDRLSAVGAMLEKSRRQGVVRGDGKGGMVLDLIPVQTEVAVGERVLTAGIDGVFPGGLLLGAVSRPPEPGEQFHRIAVAPAVDFAALSEVYVSDKAGIPAQLLGGKPGVEVR
jgi:rod shape-determining protein MreC